MRHSKPLSQNDCHFGFIWGEETLKKHNNRYVVWRGTDVCTSALITMLHDTHRKVKPWFWNRASQTAGRCPPVGIIISVERTTAVFDLGHNSMLKFRHFAKNTEYNMSVLAEVLIWTFAKNPLMLCTLAALFTPVKPMTLLSASAVLYVQG